MAARVRRLQTKLTIENAHGAKAVLSSSEDAFRTRIELRSRASSEIEIGLGGQAEVLAEYTDGCSVKFVVKASLPG